MTQAEIRQRVFNETAYHLMKQRVPSVNASGEICRLRGAHGRKCAVGYWIDDENYSEEMEEYAVEFLGIPVADCLFRAEAQDVPIQMRVALAKRLGVGEMAVPWGLLRKLQSIHDRQFKNSPDPAIVCSVWCADLRQLAHEYGLDLPTEIVALL